MDQVSCKARISMGILLADVSSKNSFKSECLLMRLWVFKKHLSFISNYKLQKENSKLKFVNNFVRSPKWAKRFLTWSKEK